MWKYIGKRTLRHVILTILSVLVVCLLFYLLSGGAWWMLGE